MDNFLELGLPEQLLKALNKMQFTTPTPIQAQAIPFALDGRDILGSAQTGTGKTGAFGIPLVAHLLNNQNSTAIVMTPTRELAVQVMQMLKKLTDHSSEIKTALLIGGESMFHQLNQLKVNPRIVVGTPGRINDHLTRKSLRLDRADFLVLDETDRMLDMGFGVQIDKVLSFMPAQRQTLMFSATLPNFIISMSQKYMKNAQRIAIGSTHSPAKAIKQEIIRLTQGEKYATLTQQLNERSGSVIIFVKTKNGADRLTVKLEKEGFEADAIHGDLRQNKRDKVIKKFREKKIRVLVATDVAARGLDIPHIEHVVNYDLPQCPEDYIHRIGRTARAGAEGHALCLVTPEENGKWAAIDRLINKGEGSQAQQPQRQKSNNRFAGSPGKRKEPRSDRPHFEGEERFHGPQRHKKPHRRGQFSPRKQFSRDKSVREQAGSKQPAESKYVKKKISQDKKFSPRGDKPFREKSNDSKFDKKKFSRDGNFEPRGNKPFRKQDGEQKYGEKKFSKDGEYTPREDRSARAQASENKFSKNKFSKDKPARAEFSKSKPARRSEFSKDRPRGTFSKGPKKDFGPRKEFSKDGAKPQRKEGNDKPRSQHPQQDGKKSFSKPFRKDEHSNKTGKRHTLTKKRLDDGDKPRQRKSWS